MGAHPYWYFVEYEPDISAALEKLRQREFKAGRYNPVMPVIDFPITAKSPAPGAKHASIDAAQQASDVDGTRSILDISDVGEEPDFCVAAPLPDEQLESLYGTAQPTLEAIEDLEFLEDVERGQAVYIIVYKDEQPSEILFAGYSFD